jgi:hypothetical protein
MESCTDVSISLGGGRTAGIFGSIDRIAALVGDFNPDMASAVAATGGTDVDFVKRLAPLVDKSLVVPGARNVAEPRFWLLESVRTYLRERPGGRDELEPARKRHALYFLALAEQSMHQAGEWQDDLFARLEREYDNVREAIQWAAGQHAEIELRLSIALTPFWSARGHVREGSRYLTDALARHECADVALRVEALDGLTNLLRLQGRFESAKAALDEALSLVRPLDDLVLVARLLISQGMLLTVRGETRAARIVLREVLPR